MKIFLKKLVVLKIEKEIDEKSLLKELFSDEKAETATIDDLKEVKKELEELLKLPFKMKITSQQKIEMKFLTDKKRIFLTSLLLLLQILLFCTRARHNSQ